MERRDSGLDWAGDIPAHWPVIALRQVARLESGHTPSRQHPEYWVPEECTTPWFSLADVWQLREARQDYLGDTAEKISEVGMRHSAARLLPAGTVVLSRTASVGFAGIMPKPMATTQDFANWVCGERLLPEYLLHVFRAMAPEFVRLRMGSTHQTIYMPDIRAFRIPLPSVDEQRRVLSHLAAKLPTLDALIAKKERLIELLEEKRQALITQAVTKGLDPSVPMKDSGIEWLGPIPAHWEVLPLKRISPRQLVGVVVNPSTYVDEQGTIPFIFGSDVREGRIYPERARRITAESASVIHKSELRAGDLITVRVGAPGVTAVVPPELDGANCASLMVVRGHRSFDSHWLCYAMNSGIGRYQVECVQYGAAQKQFNIAHAVEWLFPVPPREEQAQLACILSDGEQRLRSVSTQIGSQIERLREYRQALITAAVTGKIDLTAAADRKLPFEAGVG